MPLGSLVADKPNTELYAETLGQTFLIYPDGPVTLRLPVRLTADKPVTMELSVTYMACSAGVCFPPVIDKRIRASLDGANMK